MLVLSRKSGECIRIGPEIVVSVLAIQGKQSPIGRFGPNGHCRLASRVDGEPSGVACEALFVVDGGSLGGDVLNDLEWKGKLILFGDAALSSRPETRFIPDWRIAAFSRVKAPPIAGYRRGFLQAAIRLSFSGNAIEKQFHLEKESANEFTISLP